MFILTVSILLLMVHHSQSAMSAKAVLYGDNSQISYGTLMFDQDNARAPVRITGRLTGLNASSAHAFHVHVNPVSDGSPNCTAAGGHFNPYNTLHGPRTANIWNRHVGDLGNISTDAIGTVNINIEDWIIQLYNATQSILNRTAVVHLFRDDGGHGGFSDSTTTGNAGARILCGIIKSNAFNIRPIISNAFNIKPTISVGLMIMITAFMKLF